MPQSILTLFRNMENVHLIKDVGMIPLLLHKNHGYKALIVTDNNNQRFPFLDKEARGLNVTFHKRITGLRILDELWFIYRNAKHYDVFYTLHFNWMSILHNMAYKLARGKSGITYLKLDGRDRILCEDRFHKGIRGFFYRQGRKYIDIISGESGFLSNRLTELWDKKVHCIPNGYFNWDQSTASTPLPIKQKQIMTSGRIGAPEKNHELLCEAFATLAPVFPHWSLCLVGGIEARFQTFLEDYFAKHPHLRARVVLTGNISDRVQLNRYYERAAIFALTSRFEGFPLVFPEALSNGCFILSADFVSAIDITNNEQYGYIFKRDDEEALIEKMKRAIEMVERGETDPEAIRSYAADRFEWTNIVDRLAGILEGYNRN